MPKAAVAQAGKELHRGHFAAFFTHIGSAFLLRSLSLSLFRWGGDDDDRSVALMSSRKTECQNCLVLLLSRSRSACRFLCSLQTRLSSLEEGGVVAAAIELARFILYTGIEAPVMATLR